MASWHTLRDILLQILEALAYAHARDVVHRDIKPANILVLDAAAGFLESARPVVENSDDDALRAEWNRIRAKLSYERGAYAEAEELYQRSIDLFERTGDFDAHLQRASELAEETGMVDQDVVWVLQMGADAAEWAGESGRAATTRELARAQQAQIES